MRRISLIIESSLETVTYEIILDSLKIQHDTVWLTKQSYLDDTVARN